MAKANGEVKALKTKVRPVGDQILVQQTEAVSMTRGGIALPESSLERPKEGIVLAVGLGTRSAMTGERVPLDVKKGDRIIFAKFGGSEAKIDDQELLLISEKDVLAILE